MDHNRLAQRLRGCAELARTSDAPTTVVSTQELAALLRLAHHATLLAAEGPGPANSRRWWLYNSAHGLDRAVYGGPVLTAVDVPTAKTPTGDECDEDLPRRWTSPR